MIRAHDNSRIASGGADRAVILTDVGTGQHIRTYRGHLSVSPVQYIQWHLKDIIPSSKLYSYLGTPY